MKELTFIRANDVYTTSLVIAEGTENQHISIKRTFYEYETKFKRLGTFSILNRESTGGRPEKVIQLNEQQATFLVTLLRNNDIVVDFKLALVSEFYKMRTFLLEKQTQDWQETRQLSKAVRLQATDAIKELVDYAIEQGSQNADKLYVVYSKLVKSVAGYNDRDCSRVEILTQVIWFEQVIRTVIKEGMLRQSYYKDIYQKAKKELAELKKYWSMPRLTA